MWGLSGRLCVVPSRLEQDLWGLLERTAHGQCCCHVQTDLGSGSLNVCLSPQGRLKGTCCCLHQHGWRQGCGLAVWRPMKEWLAGVGCGRCWVPDCSVQLLRLRPRAQW